VEFRTRFQATFGFDLKPAWLPRLDLGLVGFHGLAAAQLNVHGAHLGNEHARTGDSLAIKCHGVAVATKAGLALRQPRQLGSDRVRCYLG
jgi:hypothetical protein